MSSLATSSPVSASTLRILDPDGRSRGSAGIPAAWRAFFHGPQAIDERHVTVGDAGPHAADRLAGSPGLAGGRAQSYWSGRPTLFELKDSLKRRGYLE